MLGVAMFPNLCAASLHVRCETCGGLCKDRRPHAVPPVLFACKEDEERTAQTLEVAQRCWITTCSYDTTPRLSGVQLNSTKTALSGHDKLTGPLRVRAGWPSEGLSKFRVAVPRLVLL